MVRLWKALRSRRLNTRYSGFYSEQMVYFEYRSKDFDLTFTRFALAATWRMDWREAKMTG